MPQKKKKQQYLSITTTRYSPGFSRTLSSAWLITGTNTIFKCTRKQKINNIYWGIVWPCLRKYIISLWVMNFCN